MEKTELDAPRYFLEEETSDEWKDIYLDELSTSMQRYLKTGVKNKQLAEAGKQKNAFYIKYEQSFNLEPSINALVGKYQDLLLDKLVLLETENINTSVCPKDSLLRATESIQNWFSETLVNKMESILRCSAYLSNMNMLLELMNKEDKVQIEEKGFEEDSNKFKELTSILSYIYEQHEVEVNELRQLDILDDQKLLLILNNCHKYLSIHERENMCFLSLSVKGRKYLHHVQNSEKFSSNRVYELVNKNCTTIVNAARFSYHTDIPVKMELVGIGQEERRVLEFRCQQMINDFKISQKPYRYKEKEVYFDERPEDRFICRTSEIL